MNKSFRVIDSYIISPLLILIAAGMAQITILTLRTTKFEYNIEEKLVNFFCTYMTPGLHCDSEYGNIPERRISCLFIIQSQKWGFLFKNRKLTLKKLLKRRAQTTNLSFFWKNYNPLTFVNERGI